MITQKDLVFNDNIPHTMVDIDNYIKSRIPEISEDDLLYIRWDYIYGDFKYLDICINNYITEKRFKEYGKRKDKKYYKARMYNGGYKFVYMCPEQVEELYPGDRHEEVNGNGR